MLIKERKRELLFAYKAKRLTYLPSVIKCWIGQECASQNKANEEKMPPLLSKALRAEATGREYVLIEERNGNSYLHKAKKLSPQQYGLDRSELWAETLARKHDCKLREVAAQTPSLLKKTHTETQREGRVGRLA